MSATSATDKDWVTVRVDIAAHSALVDPRCAFIHAQLRGVDAARVQVHDIWWFAFDGRTTGEAEREAAVGRIVQRLLLDAGKVLVTEQNMVAEAEAFAETGLLPGVTDTTSSALMAAVVGLLPPEVRPVAATCGRHVGVVGARVSPALLRGLANPAIERVSIGKPLAPPWAPGPDMSGICEFFDVLSMNDDSLTELSTERRLSLDLAEMKAIRAHYASLGRTATDVELETLAQTWSEHCKHKTFRARIDYTETAADGAVATRVIDGLLQRCFVDVTAELACAHVRSAFADNAGVVAFNDDYDLAVKVETHNRPSAIEPFGGANTGLGGVLRDILGVSARPFMGLDVLCFGPSDLPEVDLPPGVLHPTRVREGVVAGIADYGNKMGIPTVAGAVRFDAAYTTNPLVFAGAVGIVPRGAHPISPKAGDRIVVVGGATGRDGLRGATFSSAAMDATTGVVSGGAVQIGDPIMEKRVLDLMIAARDAKLYHAVTDCGAGGLSSAVGELAMGLGATVELADVPSKYVGLAPWEIWLSEAQERMVLAVAPSDMAALEALGLRFGCPVAVIGTFEATDHLAVLWRGSPVASLSLAFLHDGLPRRTLQASWGPPVPARTPDLSTPCVSDTPFERVRRHLLSPNGRLARDILATYDTEVQGGTVARPVTGRTRLGAGDGVAVIPLEVQGESRPPAAVVGIGLCPELTAYDPRIMAWHAIDEAIRNAVAVGADPSTIVLLDNFAWGNTHDPAVLGQLVRAAEGCRDAARSYGTPFVSGKDSLHNAWTTPDGRRTSIPGTLVVTALGLVPPGKTPTTSDFKKAGDHIAIIGRPTLDPLAMPPADTPALYRALFHAQAAGLITACHDISSGGALSAIAEMALGGGLGASLRRQAFVGEDGADLTTSTAPARFVVTFAAIHRASLAGYFDDSRAFEEVGVVVDEQALRWSDGNEMLGLLALCS